MKQVTTQLSEDDYKLVRQMSMNCRWTISHVIRFMVEKGLASGDYDRFLQSGIDREVR